MNDPGLEDPIAENADIVEQEQRDNDGREEPGEEAKEEREQEEGLLNPRSV